MRVFPVILDRRPGYLTVGGKPRSLLLLPVGTSTLLSHLHSTLLAATRNPPTVLTPFEPDEAYTEAVREACPAVVDVIPAAAFARHLSRYEPSDWLLIADSRQVPAREADFGELLRGLAEDTRSVRHLVQLETTSVGTQEFVQFDAEGQVCRIQRYYDGITWPFTGAIVSSLLPVASTLRRGGKELPFSSLSDLRTALAVGGVSSRDVPFTGGVFDLDDEAGLLALNELLILKSVRDRPAKADGDPPRGVGCRIHRSARIHGPAVIHDNVTIEDGAVVLDRQSWEQGPSLVVVPSWPSVWWLPTRWWRQTRPSGTGSSSDPPTGTRRDSTVRTPFGPKGGARRSPVLGSGGDPSILR